MNDHDNSIDPSLMNLDGGIFAALPRRRLPLEIFHLETCLEPVSPPPPERVPQDSLTPSALEALHAPPSAPRRSSWTFGLAIAAGTVLAVVGASQPGSAPAASGEQAPAIEDRAPVLAAAPASPHLVEAPKPAARLPAAPPAALPADPRIAAILAAADPVAPPVPAASTARLDRSALAAALARAGHRASWCSTEIGTFNVPVTLKLSSSGRVTMARVDSGALLGTPAGRCIAAALRHISVPAFAGDPVTVSTTVRIH